MKATAAVFAAFLLTTPCFAGSYEAPEGQHFVAVASSKNLDEAIGIARLYAGAVVVSSQNGWYGVVLGPTREPTLAAFKASYQGWPELPADAVWSTGKNYIDSAWVPDPQEPKSVELTPAAPVEEGRSDFRVTATVTRSDDQQTIRIAGKDKGAQVFDLETPADYYSEYGASLRVAELDPATPAPEVLVAQYTGGAHCCTATWIASEGGRGWSLINGETLDGGGYWLEDIDDDDAYELMSVDNAFLYAFESYAGSFATVKIDRLRGGKIEAAPHDREWTSRMAQDLAGKEFMARLSPDLWQSNGFLAAWVATKIMLGQGEVAWQKMLATYEKDNGFGPQVCTTGEPIDACAPENMKAVPFPEALAKFLHENGYTPVPGG